MRSLRLRAVVVVVLVACGPLVLVAGSDSFERGVGRRMTNNLEAAVAELQADPGHLAEVAADRGLWVRLLDGDDVVASHDGETKTFWVRLRADFYSSDGAPTLQEHDAARAPIETRDVVRAAQQGATSSGCLPPDDDGRLVVCYAGARLADGRVLYLLESSRRPIRAVYDLRYFLAKLTLLTLPAALLLAWWLGRRMIRPVEQLRAQALAHAARATPGGKLELDRGDEFGDLTQALNTLLDALDERKRANQAFVADLVHEFKNPVAAIRAASESLEGGAPDAARAERLARILRDSSSRLDDLVTRFLELARAEAGLPDQERTEVALEPLVRGVVESRDGAPVTLELDLRDGEDRVWGVSSGLESVVRNLVDNAASFADPRDPKVTVALRGLPGAVRLQVRDNGPGLPDADLDRVFDRFYTTRRTGTGLGLALVRAVVEAHGGDVRASSPSDGGAMFTVQLPRR